jgi:hypothetical protein
VAARAADEGRCVVTPDRRVTAHHEAAHAVVLYRTNGHAGEVVSIVADIDENRLGYASDGWSDSFSKTDAEGTVLSCYAGGHAQRIIDGDRGDHGCWSDDDEALAVLTAWGWESREAEFRARALELVRQHWAEIVAVAEDLLTHDVLEGSEVEMIADAVAGDPDADVAEYRRLWGTRLEAFREGVRARGAASKGGA